MVSVRVPVNASGTLADGAAGIVERITTVDRVADPEVRGLQPGLNDTVVDLHVRVTLSMAVGDRGEDVALARRELTDAVGVLSVEDVEVVDSDCDLDPAPSEPSVTVR